MKDVLRKIYVEPTNRCNLNCSICVRRVWDEPAGDMPLAAFRSIARQIRDEPGGKTISFGGYGEPLIHPGIVGMVRCAKGAGAEVHLITNGCFLDREMSESLLRAGLDRLVVSLDGATDAPHNRVRGRSQFALVKQNMIGFHHVCLRTGRPDFPVDVEFVATRGNIAELPRLRSLAMSLGAGTVIVNNLLPHTEKLRDEILYGRYTPSAFDPKNKRWNPHLSLPKMDIDERNAGPILEMLRTYPNVNLMGAPLWAGANHCRFVHEGCTVIAWDGAVSPCLALMHSYPCYVLGRRKHIQKYVLGRVPERDLGEIWRSEEYTNFRKRAMEFAFPPCPDCGACEFIESNLEDCLGNPFPVCGDCLWAQGIFQCP